MNNDKRKDYEEVESMTKEEAIKEIKVYFKGNKKFIDQASLLVNSSYHFTKLDTIRQDNENYNWEKFLSITINTGLGFKLLSYRKGNEKYAPTPEKKGNHTQGIDGYTLTIYYNESGQTEKFEF